MVGDPVPSPATWAPLHPIRSRRGSALGRSRILAGVNTVDPSQSYLTQYGSAVGGTASSAKDR